MKRLLCYGDSNTWGYNPKTKDRYPKNNCWTNILQKKLEQYDVDVIEEGLCGRTTAYDYPCEENLNGLDMLPQTLEKYGKIDAAIIMLGTNDCKTMYRQEACEIADGMEKCLDVILVTVKKECVLLISPIILGEDVWKPEKDPEFDQKSVEVSKHLAEEYAKLAKRKGVHFINAAEIAEPSEVDEEHLTEKGHEALADVIFRVLCDNNII